VIKLGWNKMGGIPVRHGRNRDRCTSFVGKSRKERDNLGDVGENEKKS
jgi:hypothetical protein